MSNLWFFRLRSGSNPPPLTMDRRRSSSERGPAGNPTQVIVDLDHNYRPYSKIASNSTAANQSNMIISKSNGPNMTQVPLSGPTSRIHSTRSSTASYCGGGPFGFTIYGDVPPLHRKSFLSGNLQNADSMDNVAQLIPRFVNEMGKKIPIESRYSPEKKSSK
ncbi:hypothetical protein QR98_0106670 [Sarcoptes scabiei]|uniref:Uncharacterized protein n=1 Tax=Sarcoptes scabiei TaxID=52283 RepID=A0A132AM82_SARSC|nr:hypothetical protein QR98_0106670 [Sarcoptes scabiei]